MAQPFVSSLIGQIRVILAKADLDSVSAKAVRKTLVAQGVDAEQIKAHKEEIDASIATIFNEIRSGPSEPAVHATPADGPKPQKKRSLSDASESRPVKKAKPARAVGAVDDESYARALQAELNGISRGARTSRSGQTSTPTKMKGASSSKGKYKSAAVLSGSDEEGVSGVATGKAAKKKKRSKSATDANGEVSETGFNRPFLLSPSLATLLGETHLSRPKTVKALWAYIKERDLQDPKDKRYICCDEAMRAVFASDRVHMMGMNKVLSKHLYNPDDVVA
ncbi:SWIB/MDM2 domain-containing protein [Filobasidium floriforme]|uniref:SWIB/MDM2 domain-containing protein n=1 Tax=Filobasidium floriforme TaxID=5210 RepID=UPI001E8E8C2F|nr:SWIB/MDM2 domain-containing protein [Filobasidium floriforme]KAH8085711.1 SWIB/MDM2 domain-containing protein [Filobasidium floriforme]